MTAGSAAGPTQTASDELQTKTWESRPWFARTVRFAIFIFPLVVSVIASLWASRTFPPDRVGLNKWVWWLGLAIAAMLLVRILERLLSKLTPLTMLFRLSLIFPDQAPSRFSVALKTGSTRSVKRRLAEIQESGELFSDEESYSSQMLELVAVLAEHDRMTRGHAERVRAYSELIGVEMGLPEEDLGKLRWSALLHDMGKLHVPSEILNKPGRPTDDEWAILKDHPAKSEAYLEPLAEWLGEWRHAAVGHHERWDGNGYPQGQAGTDIPLSARIVAVADAYDVMTSTRSYKKPMPAELARQEVADKAGSQFDPVVSRAFLSIGLGDLRRTAGPLAFFTNLPIIQGVPVGSAVTTAATGAVTAATAAVAIAVNAAVGVPEVPPAPDSLAFTEEDVPVIADPAIASLSVAAEDIAGAEDELIAGSMIFDGDGPFTVAVIVNPTQGTLQWSENDIESDADRSYTYSPDPNSFGSDSFAIRVCDSQDLCTETDVGISVAPVDDAPQLTPPVVVLNEGESVSLPVVIRDVDGDELALSVLDEPDNGTVLVDGQTLRVTHDGSETEQMSFTLVLSDGVSSVPTEVVAQVNPVNDAPVSVNDSTSTPFETPREIAAATLLANDNDVDSSLLAIASVAASNGGIVSLENGAITFTPNPGFTGEASFTYRATDGELESAETTVVVVVEPKPSEPPTISIDPVTITENSALGTVVGSAVGSDPDGDPIRYSITGGTGATAVTIDPTSGQLLVAGRINFELTPSLSLTIAVTDDTGQITSQAITVTVLDVNEPPIIAAASNLTIAESALVTRDVTNGTISATDPEGDAFTYSIVDLSDSFAIDPITGQITVGGPLNYETTSSYFATVVATDTGSGIQSTLPIEIFVVDVNEAPVFETPTSVVIAENTAPNTVVATAIATDEDEDTLTYVISDGTGADLFAINRATGEITVSSPLDFEESSIHTLVVTVTDDGEPPTSSTTKLIIDVSDINDAPVVTLGQSVSVAENTAAGVVALGSPIEATDQDGDTLVYSITDPGNFFTINAATGELIRSSATINHEKTPTHSVTVTVTDPDNATGSAEVNITVLDRNDSPDLTSPAPFSIAENQPSATVGTLTATDEDGDTLTWQLTGSGASNFAINSDGQITLVSPLDYEMTNEYVITATVTDSALPGASASTPVTIKVVDVNEPPSIPLGQIFTIPESAAVGTAVDPGPVAASDIDGDNLTFSLSAAETTVAIDPATGTLTLLSRVDFETLSSYSIPVTAEDPDGLRYTKTVTLNVIDVNEAPSIVPPTIVPVRVLENSPVGSVVTDQITAIDPENGQLRFTMVDPSNLFAIDASTGEISVAIDAIDVEDTALHTVAITVDDSLDGGAGSDTFTLDIEVVDENEPPRITTVLILPAMPEDTTPGSVITTLGGTDPENDTLGWTIVGGTGPGIFSLDALTGELMLDVPVDYDTDPPTTRFTIVVDLDDGLLKDTRVITIPIGNVDEPPVVDPNQAFSIVENVAPGTPVPGGVVTVSDPENDPVTWTISDPTNTFGIDATGQIFRSGPGVVDAETHPTYTVDVTATGSPAALPSTESVLITANNVNEMPEITLAPIAPVPENTATTTVIGTLNGTDPENDAMTWAIVGGTGQGIFSLDPATGAITLDAPVDYDTAPVTNQLTLIVELSDGTLTDTETIIVPISNIDEVPIVDPGQTFGIDEDALTGEPVSTGAVTYTDPENDAVSWSISDPTSTFGIDPDTGQIVLSTPTNIDFETLQTTFVVDVTATGSPAASPSTESVTITVLNVNEPPVLTLIGPGNVDEELIAGTLVQNVTISTFDPDPNGYTYSITGGDGMPFFAIDVNTGVLTTTKLFDAETDPLSYNLIVRVTEIGTPDSFFAEETISVEILDVNEPPVVLPAQTFTTVDGKPTGSTLDGATTVVASDVDNSVVSYAITAGTGLGIFAIDNGGVITVAQVLDYDDAQSYTLEITATDDGTPAAAGTGTVIVTITSQFGTGPSPLAGQVIINEVNFASHITFDPALDIIDNDFVEVLNTTGTPIDISNFMVTDRPIGTTETNTINELRFPAGTVLSANERAVVLLERVPDLVAPSAEYVYPSPGGTNDTGLQLVDDLFLYDTNAPPQIVAYVAWGDPAATGSEIGLRPPMTTWNLWDPTHEAALSSSTRASISLVPDGGDHNLSGCWESTASGNATANSTCANPVAGVSAVTDPEPGRLMSQGDSNNTLQTYPGPTPLISEIAVNGMVDNGTGTANFVEIYNATPFTYDRADFNLEIYVNGIMVQNLPIALTSAPWVAGQHYLVGQVGGAFGIPGVNGDAFFLPPVNSWNYTFRLVHDDYGVLDTVGSASSGTSEGNGIAQTFVTNQPQSFQRRPGRGYGPCQDTGDNGADFFKAGDGINPVREVDIPVFCAPPVYPSDPLETVVIGEITTGLADDEDEFIELFNPSFPGVPFDFAGYQIYEDDELLTTLPSFILQPGDTYLLGGEDYAGPTDRDFTKNISVSKVVELRDPGGVVIDRIIFGTQIPGTRNVAVSWERANGGCAFSFNPSTDFEWTSIATPRPSDSATAAPCSG